MWFRRKNTAPPPTLEHTIPGEPRRHARTPQTATAPIGEALILSQAVRDWLTDDVDRLELAAADAQNAAEKKIEQAERDLANAAHWRTIAAGYRRILALDELTAQRAAEARAETAPEPEPAYDALPVPPDVPEFANTWRTPDPWGPPKKDCGCDPWRGESCEQCDILLPQRATLWQSNDGHTAPLPTPSMPSLANGEQP